jgi:hypothetical protein
LGGTIGVALVTLVILLTFPAAMAQEPNTKNITVQTDKDVYITGETVIVSGTVANVIEGERLLFRLYNPLGALSRADPVQVADDRTYTYQFPSGGPLMRESGDYRIVVNYNLQEAETFFGFYEGYSDTWWTISIDGNPYVVRYQISGGTIHAISADPESKLITVNISATRDGVLKFQLPRVIIQAQNATNGHDIPYTVLIDGEIANFTEHDTPASGTRELTIPFKQDQSEIQIIGTWMVPEFSPVLALTLAVGISVIYLGRMRVLRRFGS